MARAIMKKVSAITMESVASWKKEGEEVVVAVCPDLRRKRGKLHRRSGPTFYTPPRATMAG